LHDKRTPLHLHMTVKYIAMKRHMLINHFSNTRIIVSLSVDIYYFYHKNIIRITNHIHNYKMILFSQNL
jgi:hypothetical protein